MHELSATYRATFATILLSALAGATAAGAISGESPGAPPAISGAHSTAGDTAAEWTLLADLALASPVVLRGTVARARRLSGNAAADVPRGSMRMLVEVELESVLKAPGLLPARAEWLWQGAPGPDGRPPVRAGQTVLAFLSVPLGSPKPDVVQFRLTAPAAQRIWDGPAEAAVRAILAQAQRGEAVMVTSVADGFRVAGAVAGASESQFFLQTDAGRPLTLVVTRTPVAAPQVRVATGDVIAASSTAVQPATLLWRALACGLPADLPARMQADPDLLADYHLARDSFGDCGQRAFVSATAGAVSGSTG